MADMSARELTAMVPVIGLILALGFFPQVALDVINPAVERTMTTVGVSDPTPAVPPVAAESGK